MTRRLFDVTRIDHFRAFDTYYAIPYGEETAVNGQWMEGRASTFFQNAAPVAGKRADHRRGSGAFVPVGAEALKKTGYPGMKVLQFAFDSTRKNDYLPQHFDNHCVVYTGTHDNNTVNGWLEQASRKDRKFAVDYCRLTKREGYHWGMIRTALSSVSDLAIAQMQGTGAWRREPHESALYPGRKLAVADGAGRPDAGACRKAALLHGAVRPPAEKTAGE